MKIALDRPLLIQKDSPAPGRWDRVDDKIYKVAPIAVGAVLAGSAVAACIVCGAGIPLIVGMFLVGAMLGGFGARAVSHLYFENKYEKLREAQSELMKRLYRRRDEIILSRVKS